MPILRLTSKDASGDISIKTEQTAKESERFHTPVVYLKPAVAGVNQTGWLSWKPAGLCVQQRSTEYQRFMSHAVVCPLSSIAHVGSHYIVVVSTHKCL